MVVSPPPLCIYFDFDAVNHGTVASLLLIFGRLENSAVLIQSQSSWSGCIRPNCDFRTALMGRVSLRVLEGCGAARHVIRNRCLAAALQHNEPSNLDTTIQSRVQPLQH